MTLVILLLGMISLAFRKDVKFQLPAEGITSCSLCYMPNVGDAWPMAFYYCKNKHFFC